MNGRIEIVGLLQKHIITAYFNGLEEDHTEVVKFWLAAGADVNLADDHGRTLLMDACRKGHTESVRLLLAADGIDPNKATHGRTPLIYACYNGHVECARLLLGHGAVVDQAARSGATPLFVASQNGHEACVSLLLDADGIDPKKEKMAPPLFLLPEKGVMKRVQRYWKVLELNKTTLTNPRVPTQPPSAVSSQYTDRSSLCSC